MSHYHSADRGDPFAAYLRANRYIDQGLIRRPPLALPSALTRRQWMERMLPELDHPERAYPAIHVGGTSGKGSVCVMIAEILRAASIRAGLHVTPYLQVGTEKLWVDGRYASAEQYAELVDWIAPLAERMRGPEVPIHGMASVGLFLEHFRREAVDVGVVEVGVGGRNDLTNVLDTAVAVITNVGYDHVKSLGPTLEDIAWHKAGIIRRGCRAAVYARGESEPALAAARRQAARVGAPLRVVGPSAHTTTGYEEGRPRCTLRGERIVVEDVQLAMRGEVQVANAALALAACEELRVPLTAEDVRRGLERAQLAGRLELIDHRSRRVLIDGAHNPDKLGALLQMLRRAGHRGYQLVFGSLASKPPGSAVDELARAATTVIATEPRVYAKGARPAEEVAELLQPACSRRPRVIRDAREAVAAAIERAAPGQLVVVTGSIYLAGQVRGLWYPDEQVLVQRTSWPEVRG